METTVTHEPAAPPAGLPDGSQTPPDPSASTSPTTPPTPQPTAGATDQTAQYIKLLEGTVASQNRRIQEAETRAAQSPTPPPPPPDPEVQRAEFYNNPHAETRKIIREELQESVGELREFVREFRGGTLIDRLVTQYKTDPRFVSNWDASVEAYVREQATQMPPKNLNEQTFGFLVVSAIGLKATGMLQGSTMTTLPVTPTPAPAHAPAPAPVATVVTPPYLAPSPPAGPTPGTTPVKHRQLDENEKRLLREYNASKPKDKQMDEAQFIKWQELPSAEVAFADFDKPKPK